MGNGAHVPHTSAGRGIWVMPNLTVEAGPTCPLVPKYGRSENRAVVLQADLRSVYAGTLSLAIHAQPDFDQLVALLAPVEMLQGGADVVGQR